MKNEWRYYNHAMVPNGYPGNEPDLTPLQNGKIWEKPGYPLLARWVTDYDCGEPTEWWYCIKDSEYRIDTLNSKKRYRITKGRKNFDVQIIDEDDYIKDLVIVQQSAYQNYPEKYRPSYSLDTIIKQIEGWKNQRHKVFAAFSRDGSNLSGYALINEYDQYYYFAQLKALPEREKEEVNAALIDAVLLYYNESISKGKPIVDGQRNILHETSFQDYLCRYFQFRKAFCTLQIQYRPWVGVAVNILYPFRRIILKKNGKLWHSVSSVLLMEEIKRSFKKV